MINVIVPVVSGNGAKYMTTNFAHFYKELNPGKKVIMVDFDIYYPFLGANLTNDTVHGIDNLINKIDSGILNDKLFDENIIKLKNNVHLLKGTKLLKQYRAFDKEHAINVVNLLKEAYDEIFIYAPVSVENVFSIYGLHMADKILMVVKNNHTNKSLIQDVHSQIKAYAKTDDIRFIYNMYETREGSVLVDEVAQLELKSIGYLEYHPETKDNENLISTGFKVFKSKNKFNEKMKDLIGECLKGGE